MFGPFGGFEILVLMAIGLLVFGPRRMPEIGRTLGKAMMEFRKAATELRTSIEREINIEEMKETTRSIREDFERNVLAEPREALKETRAALEEAKQQGSLEPEEKEQEKRTGDDASKA